MAEMSNQQVIKGSPYFDQWKIDQRILEIMGWVFVPNKSPMALADNLTRVISPTGQVYDFGSIHAGNIYATNSDIPRPASNIYLALGLVKDIDGFSINTTARGWIVQIANFNIAIEVTSERDIGLAIGDLWIRWREHHNEPSHDR